MGAYLTPQGSCAETTAHDESLDGLAEDTPNEQDSEGIGVDPQDFVHVWGRPFWREGDGGSERWRECRHCDGAWEVPTPLPEDNGSHLCVVRLWAWAQGNTTW